MTCNNGDALLNGSSSEVLLTSDESGDPFNACAWDHLSGTQLRTFKGAASSPQTLSLLSDSFLVSSASGKPVLNVWRVSRREQGSHRLTLPGVASALACSPCGHYILASIGRDLYLWQASSGELLRHLRNCHFQPITCVAFSQDSSFVASASEDGGVSVWSLLDLTSLSRHSDPQPLRKCSSHELSVTALRLAGCAASLRVISSSLDGTINIRCLATDQLLLGIHAGRPLHSVAMDKCESVVCGGTDSGEIFVFPLLDPPRSIQMTRSAMSARTLSSHTARVTSLSISSDGHLLASGSDDGKVMLWRLDSSEDQRNPIRTLEHRGKVTNVLFALPPPGLVDPDGYRPSVCLAQALQKVRTNDQNRTPLVSTTINRKAIEMDFYEDDEEEEATADGDCSSSNRPVPTATAVTNGVGADKLNGDSEEVKRLMKSNLHLYRMLKRNIMSNAS